MRIRFWKVWALAAGFMTASAFIPALYGQEAQAKATPKEKAKAKTEPDAAGKRTIELQLALSSGSGSKGCKIEVKPANASCRFEPQTIDIDGAGSRASQRSVTLKDVEIRGADRNVAVAITIREADGTAKTIYRGYRVAAEPKPGQVEHFTCWMTSPSRSAVVAAPDPAPTRR
ncbi:MAG: hypothetical protein BGO49_17230 [Planctomycetales bacterium 71-10]|nr:MAG: hypothetical protein BGO49_17230 [Planctomycetales bacterium 71-10]